MTVPHDIAFASGVLEEAVKRRASLEERFAAAIEARRCIQGAIRAGKPPRENYRYQWLTACSRATISFLAKLGLEFDERHPEDTSTILDVYDILNTALAETTRQMQALGIHPEGDTVPLPEESPDPGPGDEGEVEEEEEPEE